MMEANFRKSDIRSELLRQLAQAIEGKDIARGLKMASSARTAMLDRNDREAGLFRCLEAQLLYMSHDYRAALASSRLAEAHLTPLGETEALGKAFLISGKALIALGNYREAETALQDALSLFRRCDLPAQQIDACNQLARLYFIRANFRNALRLLLDAITLADRMSDRRMLGYLWGNLGRVYTMLGNMKKAAESLSLNIDISDELGDEKELAKALVSLAYLEIQLTEYDQAEYHLSRAYPILAAEGMRREQIMAQTIRGHLATRTGDYHTARRLLNEAYEDASAIAPKSSLVATPLRYLAELELTTGNLQSATRLANKTVALADDIDEKIEKGAALRILAQLELLKANSPQPTTRASALFTEAMELFDAADARAERAETLVQMARSELGTTRRQMANLFRAADIFQRLGIDNRVIAVQEMINHLDYNLQHDGHFMRSSSEAPEIITGNRTMKKLMRGIEQSATSDLPVLITGETGTGKDLMARFYHQASGRTGDFVAVNCAAFPDTLLEAELFGYRKGAFTGADADKEGLLQRANGGTFFFDEIGEMPLGSQAKLLTVIETCKARRLGDTDEHDLDIRIVAATNCDLAEMVARGTFRRDLYFRLSGIVFDLPPLSQRIDDIPLLLEHFLRREGVLSGDDAVDPTLVTEFSSRSWPGNIRQFESEVKKLVLFKNLAGDDELGELAGVLIQNDGDRRTESLVDQVEQFEKTLILKALHQSGWNKSQAARALAIHESTLRAKMKRYDLPATMIS